MNLTFKRGTIDELNDIDITQNMIYFTTDDNGIYMDDNDTRYKIFGLNDNDIAHSTAPWDTGVNKYFGMSMYNEFLNETEIANDGETFGKEAIGTGYYHDIIGENIEDSLYSQYPTITSSIAHLQSIARSSLHTIWVNDDPEHTWSNDGYSFSESININLNEKYLGYIVLMQPYIGDSSNIYPMLIFDLPSTLVDNYNDDWYTRHQKCVYTIHKNGTYATITNNIYVSFYRTNPNQMVIEKNVQVVNQSAFGRINVPQHKYFVPIIVYGWRI